MFTFISGFLIGALLVGWRWMLHEDKRQQAAITSLKRERFDQEHSWPA